jgi:predicted dehydrogenase
VGFLNHPDMGAVIIATPVDTHYKLAYMALAARMHVLLEKPFTNDYKTGIKLVDMAALNGLRIMVDHVFLFNQAVIKMLEIVPTLGQLLYYDSTRINLGLFQSDVNVVWDLAPHDLSILMAILNATGSSYKIQSVLACGFDHYKTGLENTAYVTITYDNGFVAHLNLNWLSPVKVRKTLLAGENKMLVWDDLENDRKISIYDKGIITNAEKISYRSGDIWCPKINVSESLLGVCEEFYKSIIENRPSIIDGEYGIEISRLICFINESMKTGKIVKAGAKI